MSNGEPHLEVRHLTKAYEGSKALDDLSFNVEKGRILAILGPSGCGKSTALRVIAGLVQQDSGEVWLDGERLDDVPVNQRRIGFVFQHYSLFPHMSVRKNIEFGLKVKGTGPKKTARRVKELIELVGLEGLEDRKPGQLSGGQQQRVALARALAIEPRILLLDEPFGALDAKIRKRLRRDLKKLQRNLGITTIFVTHDQEEAFEVGYMIAVMRDGTIDQIDLPRDLYDNPKTSFVAQFVGNVNVICIPATDTECEMERMVRPEDVAIERDEEGKDPKALYGILENYTFLGPYIEVKTELPNGETITSLMSKAEFIARGLRRGHRLRVTIKSSRTFAKDGGEGPKNGTNGKNGAKA
jgi:sulfate transport system ATP-binding protein